MRLTKFRLSRSAPWTCPDLAPIWFQSSCQTTTSVKTPGWPFVTSSVRSAPGGRREASKTRPEHMEEDDTTPKALPDWVELEYKVSGVCSHASAMTPIVSHVAYEKVGRPRFRSSLHTSVTSVCQFSPGIFRPNANGVRHG